MEALVGWWERVSGIRERPKTSGRRQQKENPQDYLNVVAGTPCKGIGDGVFMSGCADETTVPLIWGDGCPLPPCGMRSDFNKTRPPLALPPPPPLSPPPLLHLPSTIPSPLTSHLSSPLHPAPPPHPPLPLVLPPTPLKGLKVPLRRVPL